MPLDFKQLIHPTHTAVVSQECQGAVLGPRPVMPALVEAAG